MTKNILIYIVLVFVFACQNDGQTADVIVLSTNEMTYDGNTENGIVFNGSIVLESNETILEHGFVYGVKEKPDYNSAEILSSIEVASHRFSMQPVNALMPDTTYYVRSFVRTKSYLLYGNELNFFSNGSQAPVIEKVEPATGFWGDTIKIEGTNFDHRGKNNVVLFNEFEASKVWGEHDTIYAVVPPELNVKNSKVSVALYGKNSENTKEFEIHSPIITSISQTEGQYPDTVTVNGRYLSDTYGYVSFGDKRLTAVNVSTNMVKFKVPFIGESTTVDIKFHQLDESVNVTNKFIYNEQKILGVSLDSMFIRDDITLYAKNIDFRKADIITLAETVWEKGSRWQDSMRLIPKIDPEDYSDLEFVVNCEVEKVEMGEIQSIYRTTITHRKPNIVDVITPKISHNGFFALDVEGVYNHWSESGFYMKIDDGDDYEEAWTFYSGFDNYDSDDGVSGQLRMRLSADLLPGNYLLKVQSYERTSNEIPFTIMMPEITSFSPGSIIRGQGITIEGNYLPVKSSVYQLRHVESNQVFTRPWFWREDDIPNYKTANLIGKGEYKLEFKFGDEVYSTDCSIVLDDYFEYQRTCDEFDYSEEKGQVCFAANDKLYYAIANEAAMRVIDINTGEVSKIPTNIRLEDNEGDSWDDFRIFPTIVDGSVYIRHLHNLFEFNFNSNLWNQVTVSYENDSVTRTANINKELVVTNTDNELLKLNGGWDKIGQAHFDYFTFGIGDYYYTGYNNGVSKVALSDPKDRNFIRSPFFNSGAYYAFRHLFLYKGELYEAFNSNYNLEIARFSPKDDSFTKLQPYIISDNNYNTRFFPDVNGDVYYLVDNVVYKFVPDEMY